MIIKCYHNPKVLNKSPFLYIFFPYYLQTAEKTTKDEDYNRLRKRIRAYFGTRKCFIFGLPATNDGVLGNLEKAPESKLSERFVAQSRRFCDYIFQNVGAKHVRDMLTVTGHREFNKLFNMWCIHIDTSLR